MARRRWIVLVVALVVVGLGVGVWASAGTRGDALAGGGDVADTATVRRGDLVVTVEGVGAVTPAEQVSLAFQSGGEVAEVSVAEGDTVEAGQALVRLNTSDMKLQLARSEASLTIAEKQLEQLQAPPAEEEIASQEANVASANAQVRSVVASRDDTLAGPTVAEIAAAESQVVSAKMQVEIAQDAYDRIDESDEDSKEAANYDLYMAKEAHRAAQVQLDVLLAGADANSIRAANANVAAAVAQRDAAQAQLDELLAGATAEQIQAAEASVDQARVARDRVQLLLDQATLVASMDGVATLIDVGVGELVNSGQEVVVLSDLSILEVDMNLDEIDVARAVLGQEAVLTLDAFPGVELAGTVKYIAPRGTAAGGTVVFLVTVELAPVGLAVRSGMTADVEIVTAVQENALIIPLRAVNVEDGRVYVTRLSEQSREQVDVVLGVATDTEIEILSGLSVGDEIFAMARQSVDTERQGFGAMRSLREN